MLNKFLEQKFKLLNAYQKLIDYKIVPVKNITKETVEEWMTDLDKEEFIVSFCGQIKAGKSTLLNALIFQDDVLPSAPTPHTAKITLIKYGEKPSFKAYFYTSKEWEELKKKLKETKYEGSNYYDKYLKPELNRLIAEGIYEDMVITKSGKIDEKKSLSELNDYVGADGKFTPFIKYIEIYYPNKLLKHLTIVDTPGTNDPNPYRSKITLDWIKKSNAVVYVVYAGQPFTKQDIEFINNYLFFVPSNLMVFAINKMDSVTSEEELKSWIEEVKSDPRLKNRGIMQEENSVVYISAKGALISRLTEKYGENLPEEILEDAERLYENGFLNEEKHGLKKLEEVIEEKLIQNKGRRIIHSHRNNIKMVLRKKLEEIETEISLKEEEKRSIGKSVEEIEAEIRELNNVLERYKNSVNELKNKISKEKASKVFIDLKGFLEKKFPQGDKCRSEIEEKLMKFPYDELTSESKFILKNRIYEMINATLSSEPFENIKNLADEIYEEIEKIEIPEFARTIIPLQSSFTETIVEIERTLKEETDREIIKQLEKISFDHEKWFKKILPLVEKGDKEAAAREMARTICDKAEEFKGKIAKQIENTIKNVLNETVNEIAKPTINIIRKNTERLEALIKSKKSIQSQKESVEEELERLKEEKKKLIEKIESIEKLLPGGDV